MQPELAAQEANVTRMATDQSVALEELRAQYQLLPFNVQQRVGETLVRELVEGRTMPAVNLYILPTECTEKVVEAVRKAIVSGLANTVFIN